ncbi:MAG: type II toxin-antitoxin system VapC family toxin [Alphaproteobacteria bacterium]
MTVVIDASVAIKWFVPENLREEALGVLRTENHIAAPDLLIPDLANLALEKVRRNEITGLKAGTILSGIESSGLELMPAFDVCERALEIARTLDRSVYDCFYIAAAEQLDTVFITANVRLCTALCDTGLDGVVRALSS